MTTSLSQRATGSRHDPFCDGQLCHDKVASDRGDAFSDVAMRSAVATSAGRWTTRMLHPGIATITLSTSRRGG
ncbi:hypothetical protein Taro_000014 [Colocasia esculenta]|uniref:Uncharacterized protein n=1 Tax=Colocasia esculenta TaxID=4460 RepID=A0A843TB13_COLES|nr:hypothetical protein [Colocasia esculenta]